MPVLARVLSSGTDVDEQHEAMFNLSQLLFGLVCAAPPRSMRSLVVLGKATSQRLQLEPTPSQTLPGSSFSASRAEFKRVAFQLAEMGVLPTVLRFALGSSRKHCQAALNLLTNVVHFAKLAKVWSIHSILLGCSASAV